MSPCRMVARQATLDSCAGNCAARHAPYPDPDMPTRTLRGYRVRRQSSRCAEVAACVASSLARSASALYERLHLKL